MPFELRAIIPKLRFDDREHKADVRRRVKNVQEQTRRDFQKTTRSWKRKVKFSVTSSRGPNEVGLVAGTDDPIYGFVDRGTEPHFIKPKKAKLLRFQTGYKAKTRPNFLGSGPGGSFGSFVTAKTVYHPGNAARNFSLIISIKAQVRLTQEMSEAIDLFVKRSGGK